MKSLPEHLTAYKRTPEFTENSIPNGLLKDHNTKEGVWGRIVVLEGQLDYIIQAPEAESILLQPGQDGIVEPTVKHHVSPHGQVRFYVEFYH